MSDIEEILRTSLNERLQEKRSQREALRRFQQETRVQRAAEIVKATREVIAEEKREIEALLARKELVRTEAARGETIRKDVEARRAQEQAATEAARREREEAVRSEARILAEEMAKAGAALPGQAIVQPGAVIVRINEETLEPDEDE